MTLAIKLLEIQSALASVGTCRHYHKASTDTAPYIVWYESGEETPLRADGHKAERRISGYVYLYTKKEFDPLVDQIEAALDSVEGVTATYTSVTPPFEAEASLIQHMWTWSVV